ncbi:uncharacterized protein BT62DRAFT_924711 [Guyanagaster necrorhizus]|uniref:Uncharacterized protein n=1 Tax=Guyanagaster necrorhizus TaxID=856835 RepID=A0A9P7VF66_9AGAR|nr:uncharacterized protein BT62DRAFT_924711 [Guyanagaster necrorhizus MCA 3950]KAG7439452.1 hypothetical protein BT62DRAFT_924711 [Guyanagaster necrorhizus MCA 3950]
MSSNKVISDAYTLEFVMDKRQKMQLAYRPEFDKSIRGEWYMAEYSIPFVRSIDRTTFLSVFKQVMIIVEEPYEMWDNGSGIVIKTDRSFPEPVNISVLWHALWSAIPSKYFPPIRDYTGMRPPQALAHVILFVLARARPSLASFKIIPVIGL